MDHFAAETQVEELFYDEQFDADYLTELWDDDQALEQFSLECAFGPEEY